MRRFLFPLLFLGLPLAEIAGFVIVGNWLGLWPTLALVILSGVAGALLLRVQGLNVLRQINQDGREGRIPGEALVNGAMIVFAAVLLVIPGFLTDILGILLFIPAFRRLLWQMIGQRVVVRSSYSQASGPSNRGPHPKQTQTLDLDTDDYTRTSNPSSPWSDRPKDEP
ncbi:FxsA family protein [Rhizobium sp. FY34]|uniref:FxsA family protein n=1 Tax=Rhizobium sp. FY34 TaxID=2562309 RepID=UPI0010C074C6|nr:FxsA family protein [Rhizobium sp. FY34]